jgi:hypothetical protein
MQVLKAAKERPDKWLCPLLFGGGDGIILLLFGGGDGIILFPYRPLLRLFPVANLNRGVRPMRRGPLARSGHS